MSTQNIDRQIDQLRAQMDELVARREREQREIEVHTRAYENLKNTLLESNVSIDSFFRFAYRDIKRVVARIERERMQEDEGSAATQPESESESESKSELESTPAAVPVRRERQTRRSEKRPGRRTKASRKKKPIKIPGGRYTNIPPDMEVIHTVRDKGPRPKLIKAWAEEIGEERFMEECRINEGIINSAAGG